jgi:phosphorylcholine metabolism protein LicD
MANGFGKYKYVALDLLKKTIHLLNENNIDYYLISGTLLGYVRHKDFIPWDDDMDIIVSPDILDKLPNLLLNTNLTFLKINNYILKICLKNGINQITHLHNDKIISKDGNYSWPFIDLFIYNKCDKYIYFFEKKWNITEFEPYNSVNFLNVSVKIPKNPDYFLKINYGPNYMTTFIEYSWNHRNECLKKKKQINNINLPKNNLYKMKFV